LDFAKRGMDAIHAKAHQNKKNNSFCIFEEKSKFQNAEIMRIRGIIMIMLLTIVAID
jgi:hypothetical protein